MVRELLHREFSWRAAPYLALATAVIWLVVLLSWPPPHDNGLMPMVFCILGFTGDTQRRVSQYEAALPIPGRQLVAARLIGRLSLLWLGTFAVVAVTSEFGSPKDILTLLLAAACFTLGILAEQSVRVHDAAPPRYGFLLGMVPLVILLWPKRGPSEKTVMAILLAASAALVVRLWMTIPDGFQLAPDKLMRTRRFNMGRWISGRFQTPMWWPACRSALGNWGMVVFVLPGYLGGGGWLGGAFFSGVVVGACRRVEWLALLPVSRRRLLVMMALPWLAVALAIPLVLGQIGFGRDQLTVSTGYAELLGGGPSVGTGSPNVLVPPTYWHWVVSGDAPVIRSPWGEETQPATYMRLGLTYYNPYSVAARNSTRFLEWQFLRATEAVYGRGIPLAEAGRLRPESVVSSTRLLRMQCVAGLGSALMFLGALAVAFRFKAGGSGCVASLVWLLLLLPFACDWFTASALRSGGALADVLTFRFGGWLPESWAGLVAVALVLLAGACWVVEKQFENVELAANLRRLETKEQRG